MSKVNTHHKSQTTTQTVRSFATHEELLADMRDFKQEVTASPTAALEFLKRAGLVSTSGKPKKLIRA